MSRLTTKSYWNSVYKGKELKPVQLEGTRNYCKKKIFEIKERYLDKGGNILELGGGGSRWLAYLSQRYPHSTFCSIDYSEEGQRTLEEWVREQEVQNISIVSEDFFEPKEENLGKFDFVYSHGVVEHFSDLPEVLSAHSRYLAPSGAMLTIIPNMSGIIGFLTKLMKQEVYDVHVPHDLSSFIAGHAASGLDIIESDYLCSNNFGVLSSCVDSKISIKYLIYVSFYLLSLFIWTFESRLSSLPKTRLFSPYIYVVSKRKNK